MNYWNGKQPEVKREHFDPAWLARQRRKPFMTPKKLLIIAIPIILVLGWLVLFVVPNFTYSEGYRDGYIQKISNKGFPFKTKEADVALLGFGGSQSGKSGQAGGNIWGCSIPDHDLYLEMQDYNATQLVRIYYDERLWVWPWQAKTGYLVQSVELLDGESFSDFSPKTAQ